MLMWDPIHVSGIFRQGVGLSIVLSHIGARGCCFVGLFEHGEELEIQLWHVGYELLELLRVEEHGEVLFDYRKNHIPERRICWIGRGIDCTKESEEIFEWRCCLAKSSLEPCSGEVLETAYFVLVGDCVHLDGELHALISCNKGVAVGVGVHVVEQGFEGWDAIEECEYTQILLCFL